jgi:alkylhydroperoxidase family enzyme
MSRTENSKQPRLPYPDAPATPGVLNIERMFGHIPPDLAAGFGAFSQAIIAGTTLDPLLRELAILRVGHLSHSAYEVHQHNAFARYLGMPAEKIAAIAAGPGEAVFDAQERAVLTFVDELVRQVRPSDAALAAVREYLVCRILETAGVPIEGVEGLAVSRLSGAG